MTLTMRQRFIEIDIARGIAILLMVIFHVGYDLNFLEITSIDVWSGWWLIMARAVQYIFILSTGITLVIAYQASKPRLRHALKIFGWGMVITGVTWVLFKGEAVKFGILHFYGVSILLALPLLRFRLWNALFGGLILLVSIPLANLSLNNSWLFPLGLTTPHFRSLDYFPLFPWFGLFLIGVSFGFLFYKNNRRIFEFKHELPPFLKSPLEKLVPHSLLVYLVHQPIIFLVLTLFI